MSRTPGHRPVQATRKVLLRELHKSEVARRGNKPLAHRFSVNENLVACLVILDGKDVKSLPDAQSPFADFELDRSIFRR